MRQQRSKYHIRVLVLSNGERLPVLRERESGEPVYEPTIYSLVYLRSRSAAALTIEQALRSVMIMMLALEALTIDLTARLTSGRFLTLREVDAVMRACKLRLADLQAEDDDFERRPATIIKLEAYRSAAKSPQLDEVSNRTVAVRMFYIRDYLRWLAQHALLNLNFDNETSNRFERYARTIDAAFEDRSPITRRRNVVAAREGLSLEALERLTDVIQVNAPDNPWSRKNRERNNLIVRWLLETGLRRGELLGIEVEDINWRSNEVLIARRPDNPRDPRRHQPLVKTRDRLLPISLELARDTHRYVVGVRRLLAGARRHGHLFVAQSTGAPLSSAALNLMFAQLRRKCRNLPARLHPHVMRHTWNDSFSDFADRTGMEEEKERKIRSMLMGWSETSETAATYTRRHVRRSANRASKDMQRQIVAGRKK